jgi:uncharacterized repeat protein (TIGR03803 family)
VKKTLALCGLVLIAISAASASDEKVLWNFSGTGGDGSNPFSNYFIADAKGNLYGTVASGGTYFAGIVFMLKPGGNETILYEFGQSGAADGDSPHGRLAFDADGNLWGTTLAGGTYGKGCIFEMTKHGSQWKEKVIYSFSTSGETDGNDPAAGLTIAPDGTLYSTAADGGAYSAGVIYRLRKTGKTWKQTVIHSFNFPAGEGGYPYEGMIMDAAGNLYGGTSAGGADDHGAVYRLSPGKNGWTYSTLYSFTGENGDGSGMYWIDLIRDKAGNIFGATSFGGTDGNGTVWELVYSKAKDSYTEQILHEFAARGDGNNPYGGLAMDSKGNLYGTTYTGGAEQAGIVFELSKSGKNWNETILHDFAGGATDGSKPTGNLFLDSAGSVCGMTDDGGTYNLGIAYCVKP